MPHISTQANLNKHISGSDDPFTVLSIREAFPGRSHRRESGKIRVRSLEDTSCEAAED